MPVSFFELREAAKDLLHSPAWRRRPETICVELTAACDARCIHCPRQHMDRPTRIMPEPLFQRLVDQAADLRVPSICPNGYGEICTIPIPRLRAMFAYMRSQEHRFEIIINSNGHMMNEERSAIFIEHGVKLVNVTIDGATAATAESIRVGLSFETVEANVKNLIAMRNAAGARHPKVRVGMIAMPQTAREMDPFFARWRGVADHIGLGGFSTRLASVRPAGDDANAAPPPATAAASGPSRCVLPFRDLNIWSDGKAVLCCEDWNEELVIGDLNTQSLFEIWHSDAVSEVRAKHIARRGGDITPCAKCAHWVAPSRGALLWH